jgi:hypothetical protein
MRTAAVVLTLALCVLVAVGRLALTGREPTPIGSWEAFSHCFVGALVGAWLVGGSKCRLCGWLALALSVWELAAFLYWKGHH